MGSAAGRTRNGSGHGVWTNLKITNQTMIAGENMGVVEFSTVGLPPDNLGQQWAEMVGQHINTLEIHISDSQQFNGHFSSTMLGENRLFRVSADYQEVSRTPTQRDQLDPFYNLIYVLRGSLDLTSSYRNGLIPTGDWVFLSNTDGFAFRSAKDTSCFVIHMSKKWMKCHLPDPDRALENQMRVETPWRQSLGYALLALSQTPLESLNLEDSFAIEQIPKLLALACNVQRAECSSHQSSLHRLALQIIRNRFQTPGIDAGDVANELGISRRYLYAIMSAHGTSFGRELQRIRMSRASEMLSSPSYKTKLISEVAMSVGLIDQVHFSKCFKAIFGQTPSEYRAARIAPLQARPSPDCQATNLVPNTDET